MANEANSDVFYLFEYFEKLETCQKSLGEIRSAYKKANNNLERRIQGISQTEIILRTMLYPDFASELKTLFDTVDRLQSESRDAEKLEQQQFYKCEAEIESSGPDPLYEKIQARTNALESLLRENGLIRSSDW